MVDELLIIVAYHRGSLPPLVQLSIMIRSTSSQHYSTLLPDICGFIYSHCIFWLKPTPNGSLHPHVHQTTWIPISMLSHGAKITWIISSSQFLFKIHCKTIQNPHVCTITLWLFNIATGSGPFIDGLPIKNGDFPWIC